MVHLAASVVPTLGCTWALLGDGVRPNVSKVNLAASMVHLNAPKAHSGTFRGLLDASKIHLGISASSGHLGASTPHLAAWMVNFGASKVHLRTCKMHSNTPAIHLGGASMHPGRFDCALGRFQPTWALRFR